MPAVEALLREIDAAWPSAEAKIRLRMIGAAALMLQTSYDRGTKDSDVLETDVLTGNVRERLLQLAGHGTEMHTRHRLFIDVVPRALPLRRQDAQYFLIPSLNAALRCFEVEVMSVLDVVVGKLARFNPNDQSDIDAMVERELVGHDQLVECFRAAIDFRMDATWDEFNRYVRNLNVVERDMLGVEPIRVEEPEWLR